MSWIHRGTVSGLILEFRYSVPADISETGNSIPDEPSSLHFFVVVAILLTLLFCAFRKI